MAADEKPTIVFYFALLEKNKAGRWFAHVPDLSGVIAAGATSGKALNAVADRASRHLVNMLNNGDAMPEPTDIEKISTPKSGYPPVLIPVSMPGKQVKISISINDALLAQADSAAASSGKTRSGFIAQALVEKLEMDADEVIPGRAFPGVGRNLWGLGIRKYMGDDLRPGRTVADLIKTEEDVCFTGKTNTYGVAKNDFWGDGNGGVFIPVIGKDAAEYQMGATFRGVAPSPKVRTKSQTTKRK